VVTFDLGADRGDSPMVLLALAGSSNEGGPYSYFGWVGVLLAGGLIALLVVRRVQNAPFERLQKEPPTVRSAPLAGQVIEVVDITGERVRIAAGTTGLPSTNGFAIASLVTAIVGVGGILAVVFGHVSHAQIRRTGERGWGMATAGLIIGYFGIALGVAFTGYVLVISSRG
jgi:Domain of unknown function (DUF4190)